jgi:hypothetical protein
MLTWSADVAPESARSRLDEPVKFVVAASVIADAIATQIVAIVLVFPVAMDFYLSFLSGGRTLRRSCNRLLDPVEALGILH